MKKKTKSHVIYAQAVGNTEKLSKIVMKHNQMAHQNLNTLTHMIFRATRNRTI